jgi:hypothetical protein
LKALESRLDVASVKGEVPEAVDTTAHAPEVAGEPVLLRRLLEERLRPVEIPFASRVVREERHAPAGRRVVAELEKELHALLEQRLGFLVVALLAAEVTEPVQRPRRPRRITRRAGEIQSGPEPGPGALDLSDLDRRATGQRVRAAADGRIHPVLETEQRVEPPQRLAVTHPANPERLQRFRRGEPERRVSRLECVGERRPEVVELDRQSIDPRLLLGRPPKLPRMLPEGEHVLRVSASQLVDLAALIEPVLRKLAHRFQHREAVVVPANETELEESRDIARVRSTDLLGSLARPPAAKDREAGEQVLLRLVEQVVAPGDCGRQRALPGRRVPTAGQDRQMSFQPVGKLRCIRAARPRGGELQGEREAVEPLTDPADGRTVPEAGIHFTGPLDEQGGRVVEWERLHAVLAFAPDPERDATRHEQRRVPRALEEIHDRRGRLEQVLEVVEHEQQALALQPIHELTRVLDRQHVGDCSRHQIRVAERG